MIKLNRQAVLAGAAVPLLLLTGCSQTTDGTPNTAGSSVNSAAPSSSSAAIPKPLDPSAYLDKPCDLLSSQLLTQLGFTEPGKPDTTSETAKNLSGPACGWIYPAESKNLDVSVQVLAGGRHGGGIDNVFKTRDSGGYGFAEAVTVDGYPGAFADTEDHRAEGKCSLYVGIQDDLTFAVGVDGYKDAQSSCGATEQIATSVIAKLQGGS